MKVSDKVLVTFLTATAVAIVAAVAIIAFLAR